MKNTCSCLVPFVFILFVSLTAAYAEIYKYTDDQGRMHFVDSSDKVPLIYQEQLESQEPLARISKIPGFYRKAPMSRSSGTKTSVARSYLRGGKAELYVASWCGYCRALEKDFKERRIPYKSYDVEKSSKGKSFYKKIGKGGVPITKIGSHIIRGYKPDQIFPLLKN